MDRWVGGKTSYKEEIAGQTMREGIREETGEDVLTPEHITQ
jgi:hypothetical protein